MEHVEKKEKVEWPLIFISLALSAAFCIGSFLVLPVAFLIANIMIKGDFGLTLFLFVLILFCVGLLRVLWRWTLNYIEKTWMGRFLVISFMAMGFVFNIFAEAIKSLVGLPELISL